MSIGEPKKEEEKVWINLDRLESFTKSLATKLKTKFAAKQDTLTAGDGINISGNEISGLDIIRVNYFYDTFTFDSESEMVENLGFDPRAVDFSRSHLFAIEIDFDDYGSKNILYGTHAVYNYDPDTSSYTMQLKFFGVDKTIVYYTVTCDMSTGTFSLESKTADVLDSDSLDSDPIEGSLNPVTSDGVYAAINAAKTRVDSSLSSSSTNPVQNKVINSALSSKANTSALPTYTKVTASAAYTVPANATTVEKVYQITMGSTAYDITAASGVTWLNGEAPTTQANKTYVVSIINNLAVWGEF